MVGTKSEINTIKLLIHALDRNIGLRSKALVFIEENPTIAPSFAIPFGAFQIFLGFFLPIIYGCLYHQSWLLQTIAVVFAICGIYSIYSGVTLVVRSLRFYRWAENTRKRIAKLEMERHRLEELIAEDNRFGTNTK